MSATSLSAVGTACNCLALRRAARAAARRYDDALRSLDLNNGQFSMLVVIGAMRRAGTQAIADHLGMDRTTVTAALKPLQRRGLVEGVPGGDRRSRAVQLTDAGTTLLGQALPRWEAAQEEVAALLGGAAVAQGFRRQLQAFDGR